MLLKIESQASIWPLNLIAVRLPVFSSTMGQTSSTHFLMIPTSWQDSIFLIRIDFNAVDELGNNALHVAVIFYRIILGAAQRSSLVPRWRKATSKQPECSSQRAGDQGIRVQTSLHNCPQFLVNDKIAVVCPLRLQTTKVEVLCMSLPGKLSSWRSLGRRIDLILNLIGSLRRMRWKCSSYSSNVCQSTT